MNERRIIIAKTKTWVRAAVMAAVLFVVVTFVALAQDDELVPIIDRLPEEVFLFGASGGAVVTLLISILKYLGVVGGARGIPSQTAKFVLSVIVAAAVGVVGEQSFGAALLTPFTSMVAVSGLHETVGHAVARVVGK